MYSLIQCIGRVTSLQWDSFPKSTISIHEKTLDKHKLGDILQNTCQVHGKNAKVIKSVKVIKLSQIGENKETQQLIQYKILNQLLEQGEKKQWKEW